MNHESTPVEMMIGNLLVEETVENEAVNIEAVENKATNHIEENVRETRMTNTKQMITLENECTIYEVAEKYQQIINDWVDPNQDFMIDLSKVTEIDSCFIQLLMSCKKTALKNKVDCLMINSSAEVEEKFKGLFVEQLLTSR